MIAKNDIIHETVDLILKYNGKISYSYLSDLFCDKLTIPYIKKLRLLYAMSVIAYKIPFYVGNQKFYRTTSESFQDGLTFYNSNKAEAEIIKKSKTALMDIVTGKVLPELSYGEDTHVFFESGTGGSVPDLIDKSGITYEVKRNYFTAGSRSSLHKADYLINCSNHVIELYDRSLPNWEVQTPVRFRNVLSPKVTDVPDWVEEDDRELLSSGVLIDDIVCKLEELGFCWNP